MKKNGSIIWDRAGDVLLDGLTICITILFRCLSPNVFILLSKFLGSAVFCLIKKYRERVIQNLTLAFGKEKDSKEIEKLAREVFFNFTLTPLESVYAYLHPFERFLLKIDIEGEEYLRSALALGKGVIALGAHLGPFTLVGARLSLEGYRFNLIFNEGNYPKLWKRMGDYQRRLGQNPFPLKPIISSLKKSLNCLRRNEILYLIADEQQRRGGIPTPFFGQVAFTPGGPAILSLKTGAPILPMFIVREKNFPRRLVIGPPIAIEPTFHLEKDIETLTVKFTKVIEDTVRQYPGQWSWLNRRWKTPR
ncbi:MAG: lysophospholipid acyltransferase family protein [Deltaproteobacteria bacterium]|nr:lysophospholipid acyltransferase family protein [Deltaproteobacteria bacterium]